MFGRNRNQAHSEQPHDEHWLARLRVDNPTFAPGTQVICTHPDLGDHEIGGSVAETKWLNRRETVWVNFDPDSAAAAGYDQPYGIFFAANLREA